MEEEKLRIDGRNAVLEALRSDQTIERILVQEKLSGGPVEQILRLAREKNIPVRFERKDVLAKLCGTDRHQGIVADLSAYRYYELSDLFEEAEEKGEDPFIVVLEHIMDPHNLGAIIRTAYQAGAHGIVIPKDRAAGLTATVCKTSAGAFHYLKVAKVTNLKNAVNEMKERGLWIVAADMDGKPMYDLDLRGPIALVVGSEGKGLSPLLKKQCDLIASIPMKGKIDSLNASVSAGILLYEIVRQRMGK